MLSSLLMLNVVQPHVVNIAWLIWQLDVQSSVYSLSRSEEDVYRGMQMYMCLLNRTSSNIKCFSCASISIWIVDHQTCYLSFYYSFSLVLFPLITSLFPVLLCRTSVRCMCVCVCMTETSLCCTPRTLPLLGGDPVSHDPMRLLLLRCCRSDIAWSFNADCDCAMNNG